MEKISAVFCRFRPFLADLWSIILFRLEARLSEIFSSPKFFIEAVKAVRLV